MSDYEGNEQFQENLSNVLDGHSDAVEVCNHTENKRREDNSGQVGRGSRTDSSGHVSLRNRRTLASHQGSDYMHRLLQRHPQSVGLQMSNPSNGHLAFSTVFFGLCQKNNRDKRMNLSITTRWCARNDRFTNGPSVVYHSGCMGCAVGKGSAMLAPPNE